MAVARPLSGPDGRLFSQLLVPSVPRHGEQLSRALECAGGELSRRYRGVGLGPHMGATEPLSSGGGGS